MVETVANMAPGDENSTTKKNTRDERNQQRQKRMKQSNKTGPAGLVEPGQQNHLPLPDGTSNSVQVLEKSKMDIIPDEVMQQHIIQKILLDQWKDDSEQLKAKIQNQNQLREQRLHSTPEIDRARYQQQRRNQLIRKASHQISSMQSSDDGRCCRRFNQYVFYLRNRPKNNSIVFWRKFVSEFYAPCAKERWCLSSYENIGQPVLGPFSFPAMEAWCCDICGAKSGMGFEASVEILPRLLQMRFESGELEEIIHVEFPQACKIKSGILVLEYGKAVLETSYEQFRVARQGKLRVFFSYDLKILSWQFCVRHHEEFLPRRLVAPQVNQLIDAANQYQNSIYDCALGRISTQHLQANGNQFVKSGHRLTSFVELPMISDLGLSAKHGRCLEVTKVVNIMKDLMDFSFERKIGPIESLQTYPRAGNKTSIWGTMQTEEQETDEQGNIRSMAMDLGPDGLYNGTFMNGDGVFTGSRDDRSMLADYYQKLQRDKLLNTTASASRSEQSFLMNHPDQRSAPYLFNNPGPLHNSTLISLPSLQTSEASVMVQQHNMDNSFGVMVADSRANGVYNALIEQDQFLQELNTNMNGSQPTAARGICTVNNGRGFGTSTAAATAQPSGLANAPVSGGASMTPSNNEVLKINGENPWTLTSSLQE